MLTILIKTNGEPNVTQLTYENLWREIKDIKDAEIMIVNDWREAIPEVRTKLVACVESDCLVNSGYFKSMVGFLSKRQYGAVAMLSSSVGVNQWGNRFYGYQVVNSNVKGIIPNQSKHSSSLYPVQIGYFPGALFRTDVLESLDEWDNNLVLLSAKISFDIWKRDLLVYVNPNTTYVTTEEYVNDITDYDVESKELLEKFKREAIV